MAEVDEERISRAMYKTEEVRAPFLRGTGG
jgi:hypothetical protein